MQKYEFDESDPYELNKTVKVSESNCKIHVMFYKRALNSTV